MNCTLLALFCALPLTQEAAEETKPVRVQTAVPVDELVMERFTPRHSSARKLYGVAADLVGAQFFVQGELGTRSAQNLRLFDETILIYDTARRAQDVVAMLEKLDRIAGEERQMREAEREHEAREKGGGLLHAREYRPRFLSLEDLHEALVPYRQRIPDAFSFVEESGFVVVTGNKEITDEVISFLESIDVPAPQLLVTCFLVRGTNKPPINPAPAELAEGLKRLVGYEHIEVQARSLLRTSVTARRLSLRLDVEAQEEHYELEMSPAAYDRERGALTLADCRLLRGLPGDLTGVFRTQTTVYAGEYTVLGATGVAPQLIVIQCIGNGRVGSRGAGAGNDRDQAR